MLRVDLKHPSPFHELQSRGITDSLCLHESAQESIMLKTDAKEISYKRRQIKQEYIHLSMLADQPNFPDTKTQGDELRRFDI